MRLRLLFFLMGLSYSVLLQANDSAGTTAAGGIHFQKTPQVVMQSEQLIISPTEISVKYRFKNITQNNITRDIYFPLPPYKMQGANAIWDKEVDPQTNAKYAPFLDFVLYVNNKETHYKTITRAIYNGHDITNKLLVAHIPLNPDMVAGAFPIADEQQVIQWQNAARQLGLLNQQNKPLWQKQIIFEWQQTFPANQTITINHQYRPAAGIFYSFRASDLNDTNKDYLANDEQRLLDLFHIELTELQQGSDFSAWLQARIKQAAQPSNNNCSNYQANQSGCLYAFFYNINYILTTGANWGQSIQKFELILRFPKTGQVAYNHFYDDATVKKLQRPGEIYLMIHHFIPRKNLVLLFGTTTALQNG